MTIGIWCLVLSFDKLSYVFRFEQLTCSRARWDASRWVVHFWKILFSTNSIFLTLSFQNSKVFVHPRHFAGCTNTFGFLWDPFLKEELLSQCFWPNWPPWHEFLVCEIRELSVFAFSCTKRFLHKERKYIFILWQSEYYLFALFFFGQHKNHKKWRPTDKTAAKKLLFDRHGPRLPSQLTISRLIEEYWWCFLYDGHCKGLSGRIQVKEGLFFFIFIN